jgi:hypothetical protein
LLAGIDLLTGKVPALVRDRHRSREFIEFLKLRGKRGARAGGMYRRNRYNQDPA